MNTIDVGPLSLTLSLALSSGCRELTVRKAHLQGLDWEGRNGDVTVRDPRVMRDRTICADQEPREGGQDKSAAGTRCQTEFSYLVQ